MRYLRILLPHFQDVLSERSRSLVWMLLPLINGGLFLIFWHAAFQTNPHVLSSWTSSSLISYYLLIIVSGSLVISHVDELVQKEIYQGEIVKYLLKPLPYYLSMLFNEIPYRVIQGTYAITIYVTILFFFPAYRIHSESFLLELLLFAMFLCSFFLVHTYKMMLGMLTFWTKDVRGITDTSEVLLILFSGLSLPLDLLPGGLQQLIPFLPFSYFVYYPIMGLLGKLSFDQLLMAFGIQLLWLGGAIIGYKLMLSRGLQTFTAVGQ